MHYIIPIIAFLGLPVGKIIAYFTKEELEQGKPYFYAAGKLLLFIIAVILSLKMQFQFELIILLILGFLAAKFVKLVYAWLAFAFISSQDLIDSTLIFTYSLIYATRNKGFVKEAFSFFIPFSLLLIPSFNLSHYLTPFTIGALLFTALFRD